MNSIFRYPGGKTKKSVRDLILSTEPDFYSEFREPFVGGGGVFFGINVYKKRWINDINPELMSVYLALRDRPEDFIAKCKAIQPASEGESVIATKGTGKKYNARLRDKFDELIKDPHADRALRYFFVNRTVWGGRVNFDIKSRLYYSNPTGWNIVKTDRLEMAAKALFDVRITVGDYAPLLSEPGDDVWIYCDPPYMKDTELPKNSKLYACNFTLSDHAALALQVATCKHKVCISYDDHPEVWELYKGFDIRKVSWKYSGTSNEIKEDGKELLILNYEP